MEPKGSARRKGEKRKGVVLTLKQKIDICTRLEKGENRSVLMREYSVGSSTIYDIKARRGRLLRFFASSESARAVEHRRTLHTPKLEQLDSVLYEWFSSKRAEGAPMMLIEKAKDFYRQMQLTEPCAFSDGWLSCFKLRHGIKRVEVPHGRNSADREAAEKYRGFFRTLITEHDLSPEQIYDADEAGLLWRRLPGSTLAGTGDLRPNKDRMTVLICANAAGSHKIKPLVVGKCSRSRALRGIPHLPVVYRAQGNARLDGEILYDWFHHVFVAAVRERFRRVGLPQESKAILLLGSGRALPRETELASGNIFTIFLPGNVTPVKQGVVRNVRCSYKRDLLRKAINHEGPPRDFEARYNVKDAVFNAWHSVKSGTLRRAWTRLWPDATTADGSSDEDGSEGRRRGGGKDALAEILETVKDTPASHPIGVLRESEIREWVEADGEDEVTRSEAASAFGTLVKFAERQPCYSAQEVLQLHVLHSAFMQKRQKTRKQADIRKPFTRASRALVER
ncbi:jerky protein homolog [Tachyglossus aculeatus]|uniref:jerky protein homolog n=1 Tax=Tachyglossus aculeatus TaxID=9261 RepID=UPI0018F355ED|nr:jerky protein homolog [Tachyglossus aculeatus]